MCVQHSTSLLLFQPLALPALDLKMAWRSLDLDFDNYTPLFEENKDIWQPSCYQNAFGNATPVSQITDNHCLYDDPLRHDTHGLEDLSTKPDYGWTDLTLAPPKEFRSVNYDRMGPLSHTPTSSFNGASDRGRQYNCSTGPQGPMQPARGASRSDVCNKRVVKNKTCHGHQRSRRPR